MFRNLFLSLSRMPPFLMLLIICGLAVTATMLYMQQQGKNQAQIEQMKNAQLEEQKRTMTVIRAAKQIEVGELFSPDNTKSDEIPEKSLPQGAVQSQGALSGCVAKVAINAGDIILNSFVALQQQQAKGFDAKIKEGYRAVTFAIDTNSGVAGFIYPESHVDVLCITGNGPDVKAAPVLSDVEVIAVGGSYEKPKGEGASAAQAASSVTVLLNPDDSEKLVKAVSAGRPYLVLRNSKDHTPVATVDIAALFPKPKVEDAPELAQGLPAPSLPPPPLPSGGAAPIDAGPAAPPPPPPMHEIELWSGSKKEVLSVPQG